jgi:hypothetical protein
MTFVNLKLRNYRIIGACKIFYEKSTKIKRSKEQEQNFGKF